MIETPTFRQTLRKATVGMLTAWRLVPWYGADAVDALRDFAAAVWWLAFVLVAPFFCWLSPLVAWLYLRILRSENERREARKRRYVAGLKGQGGEVSDSVSGVVRVSFLASGGDAIAFWAIAAWLALGAALLVRSV